MNGVETCQRLVAFELGNDLFLESFFLGFSFQLLPRVDAMMATMSLNV
jgi:hypothetical protein